MIRCLIKIKCKLTHNKAYSLVELMLAVAFTVVLMTGVFGFYNSSSQVYNSGITAQTLQDGANILLRKFMEGEAESGVIYRMSTAVSYMIPNGAANFLYTCGGAAQAAPCNASNHSSEIYYCQDTPCTAGDATARWYYLNSTGTSVIYHHPATGGGTVEEKIYSAPSGNLINLRFSPAAVITPANVVEIDVDLAKILLPGTTNTRLTTISGSATTFVLLRNHP